jgi:hypothetical protein
MAMGFIPPKDCEGEQGNSGDELNAVSEQWLAWQAAEALEFNMLLKDCQEALLNEVRRYAHQLELIDPDRHSSAQAVSEVVLSLSCAETVQQRLEELISEAQRLMLAVAEVKCHRADPSTKRQAKEPAKPLSNFRRLAPNVLDALLWGSIVIFVLVTRA